MQSQPATRHMAARQPMTLAELKEKAPSIFGKHASKKMSENYTFVPTYTVIDALEKIGMVPVDASQRKAKDDPTVARHLVRFAFKSDLTKARTSKVNDLIEEVIWVNAHNGRSAAKMYYGLFRFVCANGLIVSDSNVQMVKRHIGDVQAIMAEVDKTLKQGSMVIKQVRAMRDYKLTERQQLEFATKALELRYMEEHRAQDATMKTTILPAQLLIPRRAEDKGPDVWRTFNVVQENLVQGGIEGKSTLGRATHTRQLHDVRKLVSVNMGLWDLAQAAMKKAA